MKCIIKLLEDTAGICTGFQFKMIEQTDDYCNSELRIKLSNFMVFLLFMKRNKYTHSRI